MKPEKEITFKIFVWVDLSRNMGQNWREKENIYIKVGASSHLEYGIQLLGPSVF